ncbi:hypothetical protein AZF37_03495 [endosymbiont 'TC1' of Trimyema compressum]|uniref:hypothetical protein n=1 Tax=endosymbiont 'TC1' of Trimyema compressum TaxID=243899 RepID=UPI0007F110C1|nr:hypothetical protein [endosymbiont 'TC1' of Trimyema compressum]AMP20359.1 hypothetical protein AZF37_03495 [endosymbiont 'TC1' of Trimyema compressum]
MTKMRSKLCIAVIMILTVFYWQLFSRDMAVKGGMPEEHNAMEAALTENWIEWTGGDVTIDFILNYIDAKAKVSLRQEIQQYRLAI